MIRNRRKGALGTLYDYVASDGHAKLDAKIRVVGLDFDAQLEWRFKMLSEDPFTFEHLVRLAISDEKRCQICFEKDMLSERTVYRESLQQASEL